MMDQQTSQEIADIKYQLGQLRSALGATDADSAEGDVKQLRMLVQALVAWARTQGFGG